MNTVCTTHVLLRIAEEIVCVGFFRSDIGHSYSSFARESHVLKFIQEKQRIIYRRTGVTPTNTVDTYVMPVSGF